MISEVIVMTAGQLRAARALIGWSQRDLAAATEVGLSTITDFERESRTPHRANLLALRRALEEQGVEFIPTEVDDGSDKAIGVGVRLKR